MSRVNMEIAMQWSLKSVTTFLAPHQLLMKVHNNSWGGARDVHYLNCFWGGAGKELGNASTGCTLAIL